MIRSSWFKTAIVAVAAIAVVALVVGTFQFVAKPQDTNTTPQECKDAGSDSQQCRQALLQRALDADGASALDDVDQATRLKVAEALCKDGAALGESPDARPASDVVLGQVAQATGVKVDVVKAIVPSLAQLCSDEADQVEALPTTGGNSSVTFEASGSGPVTVEYTSNDGKSVEEDAFLPWVLPMNLQHTTGLRLVVSPRKLDDAPEAANLACTISVGTTVVANGRAGSKGGTAKCAVSEQDVAAAANSVPTTSAPAGRS